MANWRRILFGSICLCLFTAMQAAAYPPYFLKGEKIDVSSYGTVELLPLYIDGLLAMDPSRVIAVDQSGRLLAVSPMVILPIIRCDIAAERRGCRIYDRATAEILVPDYRQWVLGAVIKSGDDPITSADPLKMTSEYGFSTRPATLREIFSFETQAILKNPTRMIVGIIWWCCAWFLVARLLWRWELHGWQLRPIKWRQLLWASLSVLVFTVMSLLALASWFSLPYSAYYFLFVYLAGLLLAFILTRPSRSPVSRDQSPVT